MTFWGTGLHCLLLEILPSWWLFPGLTRHGSVNSTRPVWSGGPSCWSMGGRQWLWHTGWWRASFLSLLPEGLSCFLIIFCLYLPFFLLLCPFSSSSSSSSSFLFFTWNERLWRQWPQYLAWWMSGWTAVRETQRPPCLVETSHCTTQGELPHGARLHKRTCCALKCFFCN